MHKAFTAKSWLLVKRKRLQLATDAPTAKAK